MKHLRYLRYLVRHKLFVYWEGRRLGVARWQLLIHDWHKLLPSEWFPYVEFFYGSDRVPTPWWGTPQDEPFRCAEWEARRQRRFDEAWLRHQHRAPHHWQHWVLLEDSGERKVLEMPDRYRREMVADWRGAGLALGKPDTLAWYKATRDARLLAPKTLAWVESQFCPDPFEGRNIDGTLTAEEIERRRATP